VSDHAGDLERAFVVVFGSQGVGVLRCIACVITPRWAGFNFPMDVGVGDFAALPDATDADIVELAHRYLWALPMLDLDPMP
jgi:hypothetical protein